jgi:uncharacterized membrane protein YesL
MQSDLIGPDQVLVLSFQQSFRRVAFWIRLCVWFLMLSLLVVTIPPASAGLYHAVRAALLDPLELTVSPRREFLRGVGLHFKRSYILAALNLVFLSIIISAILFWFTRQDQVQRSVTIIAISFLLIWWLCQPFLLPGLVEYPKLSAWQVYRQTLCVVLSSPLYAFAIALAHTIISVFLILLLGPSLLYIPALLALISIQALWGMTGTLIPDLAAAGVHAEQPTHRIQP